MAGYPKNTCCLKYEKSKIKKQINKTKDGVEEKNRELKYSRFWGRKEQVIQFNAKKVLIWSVWC